MTPLRDTPTLVFLNTRFGGALTVLLGCALFYGVLKLLGIGLGPLFDSLVALASSDRSQTLSNVLASAAGVAIALPVLWFVLARLGLRLLDPDAWHHGGLSGWALALGVLALMSWSITQGPLRGYPLMELSAFSILGGLAAGLINGTVEEVVFRGFVMDRLRATGFGRIVQVAASAIPLRARAYGLGRACRWRHRLGAGRRGSRAERNFGPALRAGLSRRTAQPLAGDHRPYRTQPRH